MSAYYIVPVTRDWYDIRLGNKPKRKVSEALAETGKGKKKQTIKIHVAVYEGGKVVKTITRSEAVSKLDTWLPRRAVRKLTEIEAKKFKLEPLS